MSDEYDTVIQELEQIRERLKDSDTDEESLLRRKKELHAELKSRFVDTDSKETESIVSELEDKLEVAGSLVLEDQSKKDMYALLVSIRTLRNDLERRCSEHELTDKSTDVEQDILDEMYSRCI